MGSTTSHILEFLMDCLVALQLSAQVCNDDQVAQLAKDGLAACQPIPEILGQLQAYLGLTKASPEDGVLKTIPRFRTDAERTLVSRK